MAKAETLRRARVKEAMAYGGWGETKLFKLIRTGKIVAVKDGHTTLVDLDSIDRYKATLPQIVPKQRHVS